MCLSTRNPKGEEPLSKRTVQLIQLGCPKNQVDSEEVLGLLAARGFDVDAAGRHADVLIINTCGFLQGAREEGLQVIREAARRRRKGEVGRLIVMGCLAQRYASEIQGIGPVDAIIGTGRLMDVAEAAAGDDAGRQVVDDQPRHRWVDGAARLLSTPPWTAYLKVAEGCDHTCSFCTIPSLRGPYVSKPLERVVQEARALAESGVTELNLVAQDTTAYGYDLPGGPNIGDLLDAIHDIPGIRWIRVFYAFPGGGLRSLLQAMQRLPKVCRYLDIPFQHSDRGLLRSMRRPGDGDAYLRLLDEVRDAMPDIALRTTLIVGYPGETAEAFEHLARFVESAQFDRLGVFEYSEEEGTPAALAPKPVPKAERRRRRDRIMRLQQGISLAKNRRLIGQDLEVLIERREGNFAVGRSYRDGPEVDGLVYVRRCRAPEGSYVRARITAADVYDLSGAEAASLAGVAPDRLVMEVKR